jgi:hypothetical protein
VQHFPLKATGDSRPEPVKRNAQKDASLLQKKEQEKSRQGVFFTAADLAGPQLFFVDKYR